MKKIISILLFILVASISYADPPVEQLGFPLDPNCKLYYRFRDHGGESTRILDHSGGGYHGTITGPSNKMSYVPCGIEQITNGGMEDGNPPTGWTEVYTPETFERTNVKQVGGTYSAHIVDTVSSYGGMEQEVRWDPNGIYQFSFWYWNDGVFMVGAIADNQPVQMDGISSGLAGEWAQYTSYSIQPGGSGTGSVWFLSDIGPPDAGDLYVDDVSVQWCTPQIGWHFDGTNDRVTHDKLNMGKSHTLHYWLIHTGESGIVHGSIADYHGLGVTDTTVSYNAGATVVAVSHNGLSSTRTPTLFSVVRSGTSVIFYQDGLQIGLTQTLDANNDLSLSDVGRYSDDTNYFTGIVFEIVGVSTVDSPLAVMNYYEDTKHLFE